MKVYMGTDMEGASGVCQEVMTFADEARYQEGRKALTLDVNAAVRGAKAPPSSPPPRRRPPGSYSWLWRPSDS